MKDKTYHLVVRFSDTMFDVGDVVSLHNEIAEEDGSVWFGKLGQTISQKNIDIINNKIENDIPTYLYLVKGNRKKSQAYIAHLPTVKKSKPDEPHLIPKYYSSKNIER